MGVSAISVRDKAQTVGYCASVDEIFGLALNCIAAERHEEAKRYLRLVLELDPSHVDALTNLAALHINDREYNEAKLLCRRALACAPGSVNALVNLACALLKEDPEDGAAEAAGLLRTATGLDPTCANAWLGLAEAYIALCHHRAALDAARNSIVLSPKDPRMFAAAGRAALGNEAAGPDHAETAAYYFTCALALAPKSADYWFGLASALDKQDKTMASAAAYRTALALNPTMHNVRMRLAVLCPAIPESVSDIKYWSDQISIECKQLLETRTLRFDDPYRECNFVSSRHAYYDIAERQVSETIAQIHLNACPRLQWVAPHCKKPGSANRRLRVAIATVFSRNHIVAHLAMGIVRHLDRSQFEVIAVIPPRSPASRAHLRKDVLAGADYIVELPKQLISAQEALAALKPDVFFPLDVMMDPMIYFLSFARLAPVQLTTWGHPLTTGIPNMDYFLSANEWEESGSDAFYSERLIRMRHLPMYVLPPEATPELTRSDLGLPEDKRLYVCPQSLFKLHPDFDAALGRILERDPKGVLVLVEGNSVHWRRKFLLRLSQKFRHVLDRVIFLPRQSVSRFVNIYRLADAVLDPWYWSGGNTTIEALAVDQPAVTLPGRFMRGKLSLGFYRRMGCDELVVNTGDEYVELNLRIARDEDFRRALRAKVAERRQVLYEQIKPIRELERFFVAAVENARCGKKIDEWSGDC